MSSSIPASLPIGENTHMRIIFAGTPEFARVALAQLQAAGFDIPLVLTQPDRPAGRGMKLQFSPVKQFALEHKLTLAQPRSLRLDGKYPDDAAQARAAMEAANADVMVVAAYGLMLPQWVLDLMGRPKFGCLNIHASLLPRWRGAAPIHRAIEAGDTETGITLMQMDAGLDTGEMLLTEKRAIAPDDNTASLHDRLATLGADLLLKVLAKAERGELQPRKQSTKDVTYAHKIEKHEALMDWTQSAAVLERRIRAFNPFPVAVSTLAGEPIKFWQACLLQGRQAPASAVPGQVLALGQEGVDIAAIDGVLRVSRLQKPGGKPLPAAEFVRGFALEPGMVFSR
jgi:methionyl-tRNA formyltransferase